MKKGWSRQQAISIILTIVVLAILIISGPAAAVTLYISLPLGITGESSSFSFTAAVDVETGESIPVQNLTITIVNSSSSKDNYTCIFDIAGNNLTACTGISVNQLNAVGYANTTNYGYGFTTGGSSINVTFGTSYGYGADSDYTGANGELKYNITWTTPAVTANTNYLIHLYAAAADSTNQTTYRTVSAYNLTVQDTVIPLNDTMNITNNNTEITIPDGNNESNITIPSGVENVTLNVSSNLTSNATATTSIITGAINIDATTSVGLVTVQMPANLTITANTSWTGGINVPTVKSTSSVTVTADSGQTATVSEVIEIGFDDIELVFDQAVRILIEGEAGNYVGYSRAGVFTQITDTCSADSQAVGNALSAGADCKIDSGSDLVVWTKHFTSFITYTQATTPTTPSGGGGGGGYYYNRIEEAEELTSFVIIDLIRDFYEGGIIAAVTAFDIIDKIREFYRGSE